MRIYKHEFCLSCFKENPQDREICECGGRNFVFGDYINIVDNQLVCDCGGKESRMVMHVNMSPIYNKSYACSGCGRGFGVQTYYNEYEDIYDASNFED
jgi:hypothetical protein